MAPVERVALEGLARSGYERGRALQALGRATLAIPIVAAMFATCPSPHLATLCGLLLFFGSAGLWWRGETYGRAVLPGAVAGLIPLAAAPLASLVERIATVSCWQVCVSLCAATGILAGIVIGYTTLEHHRGRRAFALSAVAIALVVGAPGCAFAGILGVAGMLVGLGIVSVPLALRVPATQS